MRYLFVSSEKGPKKPVNGLMTGPQATISRALILVGAVKLPQLSIIKLQGKTFIDADTAVHLSWVFFEFSKKLAESFQISHWKGKISSTISTDATFSQARVDQLCAFAQIEDVSVYWKLAKILATDSKPAGFSDLEILYPKRETIKVSHVIF